MAPNPPLDILQSMINGILIETGKALRSSNKDGARNPTNVNTRLKTFIPSATENFHQALDDLESDIVRAKAVLLRDLEEIRSKRIALENPEPILDADQETKLEKSKSRDTTLEPSINESANGSAPSPNVMIKQEVGNKSPEKQTLSEPRRAVPEFKSKPQPSEDVELSPRPIPAVSANEAIPDSKPVSLGIDTKSAAPGSDSAPGTADLQNSAVDSLFDIPEGDNTADSKVDFDQMDFAFQDSSATQTQQATQTQHTSQAQTANFDLSTFGTQDFNMTDLNASANPAQGNANASSQDKQVDAFAMASSADGDNSRNLNLDVEMAGAEDSVFDDIFFNDDEAGIGGQGEMQHGDFDDAFFGI
ncbi:uncharacterized protein L3040_003978 [Drepanopeziza brunnea f. sp. 'multigermtubi']|uniref:uncharacterized protein n=1 Tax=Drepanopeziza brunnea f. sp. 'multigermtubi' TaxID=698441 RepID=UPI00239BB8E6|nr:hypothetical protein L3040_003978 [Drepanopeziza brunnea f. sp. 'multigermtubi']